MLFCISLSVSSLYQQMPTAVETTPERGFARLTRALSKLSLKSDDRREKVKSPKAFTPSSQNGPWSIPIPAGISKSRAHDYMHSTSLTSNGRPFLPQYSEIVPNTLFISDQYTGTDPAVLSELRITHVVCVVHALTPLSRPLADLQYHNMVVPSDPHKPDGLLAKFDDAVDFIDSALRTDGSRVLVHCRAGIDWSPCVAIAWLMRNDSCTYEAAKETVRRKREVVNPSLEVEKGVREWWALEMARPLFPPGRGGRKHGDFASQFTFEVDVLDDESLGEVIDIR